MRPKISLVTVWHGFVFLSLIFTQQIKAQHNINEVGEAYINAFNEQDSEKRIQLIESVYSKETLNEAGSERIQQIMEFYREDGGEAEFHHAELINEGKNIHIYAYRPDLDKWHNFQGEVKTENEEYKIVRVFFIADASEPQKVPDVGLDLETGIDWLNDFISKIEKEEGASGSIVLADSGQSIFTRYFGYRNLENSYPIDSQTVFNMASGSKIFTAISILQLMEQQKLRLDDPVITFLPDYPDSEWAKTATVHHLLTHSSGLGDFWDEEFDKLRDQITTLQDIYPFVTKQDMLFNPGEDTQYSNSGYLLLGLIIEEVSGINFYDYVKQNIFNPLDMESTDYFIPGEIYSEVSLAIPYSEPYNSETDFIEEKSGRGSSAGEAYSNVKDLMKFHNGLMNHQLLSKVTTELLFEPKVTLNNGEPYGYAMIESKIDGVKAYGHGGIAPGVNFVYRYFPDKDITMFIFCNYGAGGYSNLLKYVDQLAAQTEDTFSRND